MTNFQVYKKTLPFSFILFGIDLLSLLILAGSSTIGFFVANGSTSRALIGLVIGFVIGMILTILINIFVNNRFKAAQIGMMVKGVTENQLPEHTVKEGMNEVKGRFGKITAFFLITNAIKSLFRQIGRGINKIGTAIGGDVGNSVTSAIDSAIQILIGYLCDCCLGWILYRKEENAFRAGCEGAVIFFKHGKTLIRNIGRIFGMGFLSFLLVGGIFFGGFYLIFSAFPGMFQTLSNEIIEAASRGGEAAPEWITNITVLTAISAGILAIILWSMLHSVLVRPFILVGVLRNYMEAGQKELPTEADFKEMESKFPRFSKLQNRI